MNKTLKYRLMALFCVVTMLFMSIFATSCGRNSDGDQSSDAETTTAAETAADPNEERALVIGMSEIAGVFSPFFAEAEGDRRIMSLCGTELFKDDGGGIQTGGEYPVAALSFNIFYTDTEGKVKNTYAEGDRAVCDIVLKNGMKFSDGSPVTADDVLFSMYVALDPLYNGQSQLSTLPILGLKEYRTQTASDLSEKYRELAGNILAAGKTHVHSSEDAWTAEQQDTYWNTIMPEAGKKQAQSIIDFVFGRYANDGNVQKYFSPELTIGDVNSDENMKVAFAAAMWGYGSIDENGIFTTVNGNGYDLSGGETMTAADFWNELYTANEGDFAAMHYESVGNYAEYTAEEMFVTLYGQREAEQGVRTVSGITRETVLIDGVEHEVVRIVLTSLNIPVLSRLNITVAPHIYYTSDYEYPADAIINSGCEYNSLTFMEHLHTLDQLPLGGGAYKMSRGADGGFFENGTVYFERNTFFETMGGDSVTNADARYLRVLTGDEKELLAMLGEGKIMYADFSSEIAGALAVAESNSLLATYKRGGGVMTFASINPTVYPDLNVRRALATLFDTSLAEDGTVYKAAGGMFSERSWAYMAVDFGYDGTAAAAKKYFEAAGYTFTDGVMTDPVTGEKAVFTFSVTSSYEASLVRDVFDNACKLLTELGADASVAVSKSENNVSISAVPAGRSLYASILRTTGKSSMALADTVKLLCLNNSGSSRLSAISEQGKDIASGAVTIDGSEYSQSAALEQVVPLIARAVCEPDTEIRNSMFRKALGISISLVIDVPLCENTVVCVADTASISAELLEAYDMEDIIWNICLK